MKTLIAAVLLLIMCVVANATTTTTATPATKLPVTVHSRQFPVPAVAPKVAPKNVADLMWLVDMQGDIIYADFVQVCTSDGSICWMQQIGPPIVFIHAPSNPIIVGDATPPTIHEVAWRPEAA
jgi:hypothetical protein